VAVAGAAAGGCDLVVAAADGLKRCFGLLKTTLLWRRCGTVETSIWCGSVGFLWRGVVVVAGCPICRWRGEDETGRCVAADEDLLLLV
jgi:hypothetical protein